MGTIKIPRQFYYFDNNFQNWHLVFDCSINAPFPLGDCDKTEAFLQSQEMGTEPISLR